MPVLNMPVRLKYARLIKPVRLILSRVFDNDNATSYFNII